VEQLKRAEQLEERMVREGLIAQGPSELAGKIGRALVLMHHFKDAIEYYRKAVAKQPAHAALAHDLAELHMKLGPPLLPRSLSSPAPLPPVQSGHVSSFLPY